MGLFFEAGLIQTLCAPDLSPSLTSGRIVPQTGKGDSYSMYVSFIDCKASLQKLEAYIIIVETIKTNQYGISEHEGSRDRAP